MSTKQRKPIALFFITALLLIALVLTSTLAWFVANRTVAISSPSDENLAVTINAGDLEVAVSYQIARVDDPNYRQFAPYTEFGDTFNMTVPTPQFMDVTGNGQSLWFPSYLDANDQPPYRGNDAAWDDVTTEMNYVMTLHMKFRTTHAMDVYLDNRSFITGVEALTGASITRSSADSNYSFSADAICGCVRAAFLETDNSGTETLKAVWIPNDNLRIHYEGSTAVLETDVQEHAENCYWIKNDGHMVQYVYEINPTNPGATPWDNSSYMNGKVIVGQDNLAYAGENGVAMANFSAPLLTFEESGTVQTKDMIVRIWFEGTDNEADKACDGGKIKYNFGFTGITKEPASPETLAAFEGITYYEGRLHWPDNSVIGDSPYTPAGGKEPLQILYSYNCIDWVNCGQGHTINADNYDTVYIRTQESATQLTSHVRILPLKAQQ